MPEDALGKAERYRKEANKYGELAKQAEPRYLANVFRKIAVRYVLMAEDVLRTPSERRSELRWWRSTYLPPLPIFSQIILRPACE
jgi:hypothetical protein